MNIRILCTVGITMVMLAGCGSVTATTPHSSPTPTTHAHKGGSASGQLVAVNATTLTLTGIHGDVPVDYTSKTRVDQLETVPLSAITTGLCVAVFGQWAANASINASRVSVTPAGRCTATHTPQASSSAGATTHRTGAAVGTVTAVTPTSLTLRASSGAVVSVSIPTTVQVTKITTATSSTLQVNQCILAVGPVAPSGTVQAKTLTITLPNTAGTCTTTRVRYHRKSRTASP